MAIQITFNKNKQSSVIIIIIVDLLYVHYGNYLFMTKHFLSMGSWGIVFVIDVSQEAVSSCDLP